MKRIFIYLILTTCLFFACTGPQKQPEYKGEKVTIQKNYNQMGKLESEISAKDGLKHGPAKYYYDNGNLRYLIYYENGKKNGESNWYYENEKLYQTSNFVDGKEQGIKKKFYQSGKLMAEIPYSNDEQQPGIKEYTEDGKLITDYSEIVFEKPGKESDTRYMLSFHMSNNAKEVAFRQLIIGSSGDTMTSPVSTIEGTGEIPFFVQKGGSASAKIIIRAETRTKLGNKYISFAEHKVYIKNP